VLFGDARRGVREDGVAGGWEHEDGRWYGARMGKEGRRWEKGDGSGRADELRLSSRSFQPTTTLQKATRRLRIWA
jgi:hypothetical protein